MIKKIYYWFHKRISKPEEKGEPSAGYWSDMVRATVLDLCKSSIGDILEVGCGEGLFLIKVAEANQKLRIFGIDNWKDIILTAKKRLGDGNINNVDLVRADAITIPFKDNCFDTVVCINVFYNIPTDEIFHKSLQEITRVCIKGGRVIFDIRNSLNPLVFVKYKLAKYYDETIKNLPPFRTHRLNEIAIDLEKQNFEVIRRIPIGFPKNNFAPIFVVEAKKKQ